MLNSRLTEWREEDTSRQARGQAGFTKNKRTTDHMLLLEHVIHKYTKGGKATIKAGKRLFTCFVDLAKAFDTINRPQLWERLEELGIKGTMLNAIKSYYANISECVRTPDGLTEDFNSKIGVKQGCPLSPTLFGFYMDKLEIYMKLALPESSIKIGDEMVPLLFYADDIVCMARSEVELQTMINIFSCFCTKYGLTMNISKTVTMVFGGNRSQTEVRITYRDQILKQVEEFRYLGMTFHWSKGPIHGGLILATAAKGAMNALISHSKNENITDIRLLCQLFDSLITPILLYGCEIWGHNKKMTKTVDGIYNGFLKRLLGVPTGTDSNVVLAELGQIPMRIKMVRRQCNYWNRLVDLDDNSLLHKATKEQLVWIKNMSNKDRRCWINVTSEALKTYKINIIIEEKPIYVPIHLLQALPDIHEDEIFYTKTINNNQDNRDLYSSQLFNRMESYRSRTYAQWFWRSGYPLGITNSEYMRTLIRFRVGAHKLQIVTDAWAGITRINRICKCCNMNIVEDEFHLTFECILYTQIRTEHKELFLNKIITQNAEHTAQISTQDALTSISSNVLEDNITIFIDNKQDVMYTFFDHANQNLVARFICKCLNMRRHKLGL
jgi:hypothetical protein